MLYEDNWILLVVAIVERARRDAQIPGQLGEEARIFLIWIREEWR